MASWRLAKSLMTLRNQINAEWPNRSKASDGTIGDTAHATRVSDHNPNSAGVVQAIDLTDDDRVGADMGKISEALRASRDSRIKYVIHGGRYFSPKTLWQWRTYTGFNAHMKHMHVSVQNSSAQYDNTRQWDIGDIGDDEVAQFTEREVEILKGIVDNLESEGSNQDALGVMVRMIRWLRVKFQGEAGVP